MTLQLVVTSLSGENLSFSISILTTVSELKQEIKIELGIKKKKFNLRYEGDELSNTKRIVEYGVSDGDNLIMVTSSYAEALNLLKERGIPASGKSLIDNATEGNNEIVENLLLAGVPVDVCSDDNNGAIHVAIAYSHLSTLKLLVKYGSDIDIADSVGCTPLMYAAAYSSQDCLLYLISLGADMHAMDPNSNYRAIHLSQTSSIETLLKHGAEVDCRDVNNQTPLLQSAGCQFSVLSIPILLKYGADISATNKRGQNSLAVGADAGILLAVKQLLKVCDTNIINHRDKLGKNALMYIIERQICD